VAQAQITSHVLSVCKTDIQKSKLGQTGKEGVVEKWLEKSNGSLLKLDSTIGEMKRAGSINISMLIIAEQRLRHIFEDL
jgi:NAD-specific glutamate dehydrogenase